MPGEFGIGPQIDIQRAALNHHDDRYNYQHEAGDEHQQIKACERFLFVHEDAIP